jgi:hypothetical protein
MESQHVVLVSIFDRKVEELVAAAPSPNPSFMPSVFQRSIFAMNTRFSMVLVGIDDERAEALAEAAEYSLRAIDIILDAQGHELFSKSLPAGEPHGTILTLTVRLVAKRIFERRSLWLAVTEILAMRRYDPRFKGQDSRRVNIQIWTYSQ